MNKDLTVGRFARLVVDIVPTVTSAAFKRNIHSQCSESLYFACNSGFVLDYIDQYKKQPAKTYGEQSRKVKAAL